MTEFAYTNVKNTSTTHTYFQFNCGLQPRASYKENVNPQSMSKVVDKLVTKLKELTVVYRNNLKHGQEFQKQYYDKHTKLRRYVPSNKVWLNSKYIKTKRNRKLEAKFFCPF